MNERRTFEAIEQLYAVGVLTYAEQESIVRVSRRAIIRDVPATALLMDDCESYGDAGWHAYLRGFLSEWLT